MIGLINIEDYISIFNITEESNKFQLYTDPFDSHFSFTELKDKVAHAWSFRYFKDLEHKIYGPNLIKTYRKLSIEKSQTDGYYIQLLSYMQSSVRDFVSYLRFLSSLDEKDIQLISINTIIQNV